MPEGLEATAAAAMMLDDIIKLLSYSMARVASEADGFVRLAPFPVTNMSPAAEPIPEVPDARHGVADPGWRPSALTNVYTPDGVRRIMGWFERMRRYEENGIAKAGSGLRRPEDLVLGDDYVQQAAPLAPVIRADRVWEMIDGYHDRPVIDQLCNGHRNMSRCPTVTVPSANHSGALRFHEAVAAQCEGDSAPELGWLGGFSQSMMPVSRSSRSSVESE